jgi:prominin 1
LSGIIDDVRGLVDSSLSENVQKGQQALQSIENDVEETIQSNVGEIKKALEKVGKEIHGKCNEITERIEKIADIAGNHSYKYFDVGDDYIAKYSVYRYWAGIGISSVLLIVLVFVAFGLLCGICGRRPDGYGDDCCNKGAGARFLMW